MCTRAGRFHAKGKGCWTNISDKCISFILELFFSILASQIKHDVYCNPPLCTVMHLLPLWLLFKHLTTVIVLYINYTPWWLLYYHFFSKMGLADISSLITCFINNFNTMLVLIWCCWHRGCDGGFEFQPCFVILLCYFALPFLTQQTRLGSQEESQFRSELCVDNLYDQDTWPQISICIQLAIRAKATPKWFAKNRQRNDGLETERRTHKITARHWQALP